MSIQILIPLTLLVGGLVGWVLGVRWTKRRIPDYRELSASINAAHFDELARLGRTLKGRDIRIMLASFNRKWGRFIIDVHRTDDRLSALQHELHALVLAWEGRLKSVLARIEKLTSEDIAYESEPVSSDGQGGERD